MFQIEDYKYCHYLKPVFQIPNDHHLEFSLPRNPVLNVGIYGFLFMKNHQIWYSKVNDTSLKPKDSPHTILPQIRIYRLFSTKLDAKSIHYFCKGLVNLS